MSRSGLCQSAWRPTVHFDMLMPEGPQVPVVYYSIIESQRHHIASTSYSWYRCLLHKLNSHHPSRHTDLLQRVLGTPDTQPAARRALAPPMRPKGNFRGSGPSEPWFWVENSIIVINHYYIILYCIILYYIILYCVIFYIIFYIILYFIILYYIMLCYIILCYIILYQY